MTTRGRRESADSFVWRVSVFLSSVRLRPISLSLLGFTFVSGGLTILSLSLSSAEREREREDVCVLFHPVYLTLSLLSLPSLSRCLSSFSLLLSLFLLSLSLSVEHILPRCLSPRNIPFSDSSHFLSVIVGFSLLRSCLSLSLASPVLSRGDARASF